ncbi:MAG: hypothetical protein ACRYGG_18525, partial [Janthinobacterium lividum]
NGKHVPDHYDGFNGPKSFVMSRDEAARFAQTLFDHYCSDEGQYKEPTVVVAHDIAGDLRMLGKLGVDVPNPVYGIDTKKLFEASYGRKGANVAAMLAATRIPYARLHNAGNDAYYTLLAALKMSHPQLRKLLGMDAPDFRQNFVQMYGASVGKGQTRFDETTPDRNFDTAPHALSFIFQ